MFTDVRHIERVLCYQISVIDVNLDPPHNKIAVDYANNLADCVNKIEKFQQEYDDRDANPIFVEVSININHRDVRLEAIWIDD